MRPDDVRNVGACELFAGELGEPSILPKRVAQILPGRKCSRWALSPFGVTVSFTLELNVYPGLTRNPSSAWPLHDIVVTNIV